MREWEEGEKEREKEWRRGISLFRYDHDCESSNIDLSSTVIGLHSPHILRDMRGQIIVGSIKAEDWRRYERGFGD